MVPTLSFRHVWRIINDGNTDNRVLRTQQWWRAEGWEHEDYLKNKGEWQDIEISTTEPDDNPTNNM